MIGPDSLGERREGGSAYPGQGVRTDGPGDHEDEDV